MKYKDYYATLGVARDANADQIKAAYRKLARKYHPDVSKEAGAEEKFKEVSEAYETLNDPERRLVYDRALQRARVSSPQTPARVIEPLSNRVTVEPITSARFTSVGYREPVDFIHVQIDVDALFEQLFRSFDVRFSSVRHSGDF